MVPVIVPWNFGSVTSMTPAPLAGGDAVLARRHVAAGQVELHGLRGVEGGLGGGELLGRALLRRGRRRRPSSPREGDGQADDGSGPHDGEQGERGRRMAATVTAPPPRADGSTDSTARDKIDQ